MRAVPRPCCACCAGEVVEGLDLAVQKMKKGEKAELTIAPQYAFGDEVSASARVAAAGLPQRFVLCMLWRS